jgi:hypothetical protein
VRRWTGWVLVLLMAGGCASTRPAVSPWPLAEQPGEFRAVLTASVHGGETLYVLEARGLMRAVHGEQGWVFEDVPLRPRGVDWFGGSSGDVDGDGDDEIVLWGVRPQLVSVVLEATAGGGLEPMTPPTSMLLRTVRIAGGSVLCGQRGGAESAFAGPVQVIRIEQGSVERDGPLEGVGELDVLDFFFGPLADAGESGLYAWDRRGELERRERGAVVWHGPGMTTARPLGREREVQDLLGSREAVMETWTIPPLVVDLDDDGTPEVLTVTSDASPVQVLERLRSFRGGRYEMLTASGRGLERAVESLLLGRFATGVAVADLDHDGHDEVVVAIVLQRRSGVGQGRSTLVVLDPWTGDPDPAFLPDTSGETASPAQGDRADGSEAGDQ